MFSSFAFANLMFEFEISNQTPFRSSSPLTRCANTQENLKWSNNVCGLFVNLLFRMIIIAFNLMLCCHDTVVFEQVDFFCQRKPTAFIQVCNVKSTHMRSRVGETLSARSKDKVEKIVLHWLVGSARRWQLGSERVQRHFF